MRAAPGGPMDCGSCSLPRDSQNLLAFHPAPRTRGHSQEAGLSCSSAPPTMPCPSELEWGMIPPPSFEFLHNVL